MVHDAWQGLDMGGYGCTLLTGLIRLLGPKSSSSSLSSAEDDSSVRSLPLLPLPRTAAPRLGGDEGLGLREPRFGGRRGSAVDRLGACLGFRGGSGGISACASSLGAISMDILFFFRPLRPILQRIQCLVSNCSCCFNKNASSSSACATARRTSGSREVAGLTLLSFCEEYNMCKLQRWLLTMAKKDLLGRPHSRSRRWLWLFSGLSRRRGPPSAVGAGWRRPARARTCSDEGSANSPNRVKAAAPPFQASRRLPLSKGARDGAARPGNHPPDTSSSHTAWLAYSARKSEQTATGKKFHSAQKCEGHLQVSQ